MNYEEHKNLFKSQIGDPQCLSLFNDIESYIEHEKIANMTFAKIWQLNKTIWSLKNSIRIINERLRILRKTKIDPDSMENFYKRKYEELLSHQNNWYDYGRRCIEEFKTVKHENNKLRKNNERMKLTLKKLRLAKT